MAEELHTVDDLLEKIFDKVEQSLERETIDKRKREVRNSWEALNGRVERVHIDNGAGYVLCGKGPGRPVPGATITCSTCLSIWDRMDAEYREQHRR